MIVFVFHSFKSLMISLTASMALMQLLRVLMMSNFFEGGFFEGRPPLPAFDPSMTGTWTGPGEQGETNPGP